MKVDRYEKSKLIRLAILALVVNLAADSYSDIYAQPKGGIGNNYFQVIVKETDDVD